MKLPKLPNYIAVPDYPPHCVICGYRAESIGDFTHTNFKGAIYDCPSRDITHRFIDQQDDYFCANFWDMKRKEKNIYMNMSMGERRVFLNMSNEEKGAFLKFNKNQRTRYLKGKYNTEIDEYDNFLLNSNFIPYVVFDGPFFVDAAR